MIKMINRAPKWFVISSAVLVTATSMGGSSQAEDRASYLPTIQYTGLLNDYTPSAAITKGGPYEMRGKWSLGVDEPHGTAKFSAAINMETSDYGIAQGTVNKDDPTTRGAHTHHISLTDGVVSSDWTTACPKFSPTITEGFVITGTATVTGNGSPAPFGNPSPLTICVLGGPDVKYSNVTIAFGVPASNHFGTQAIHGVVERCYGRWGFDSADCKLAN